jgi:uncharacterized protein (TIGR03437 family)
LIFLGLGAAGTALAASPAWDSSGNGLLNGNYSFRHVIYQVSTSGSYNPYYGYYSGAGGLQDAIALYGGITFHGDGTFSINGMVLDLASGSAPAPLSLNGTYSIAASGHGFLVLPFNSTVTDIVWGSVSNGTFIGSSTETGFNDLFIATLAGSPTTASFQGHYTLAYMNITGSPGNDYDLIAQLNPNGAGSVGTVATTGYVGGFTTPFNVSESGVKYFISGSAAVITFPNSSSSNPVPLSGQEYLNFSADGNFVYGGSPNGVDMFVGVKNGAAMPSFEGLYYQAGIDEDLSQLASTGAGVLDTYYGALKASGGVTVGHRRIFAPLFNANTSINHTYSGTYTLNSDGTYSDTSASYVVGPNGNVRIGIRTGTALGVNVALLSPPSSGSGVFLDPTGIVNAASYAPFTAGVADGELITLYGSNLASTTDVAASLPFPTSLDNVRVMINGRAAPIYYVSPTQISVIVPYATEAPIAGIQVINNEAASNLVTERTNLTAPGIFTVPPGGVGTAAALHPNYALVTADNPALAGETIAVYLTGLGGVYPPITDGAPGSTDASKLNVSTTPFTAYIGGTQATITYQGLAPGLSGLYQMNITVPTGVSSGDNALLVAGPDSYTVETTLPIGQ